MKCYYFLCTLHVKETKTVKEHFKSYKTWKKYIKGIEVAAKKITLWLYLARISSSRWEISVENLVCCAVTYVAVILQPFQRRCEKKQHKVLQKNNYVMNWKASKIEIFSIKMVITARSFDVWLPSCSRLAFFVSSPTLQIPPLSNIQMWFFSKWTSFILEINRIWSHDAWREIHLINHFP